MSAVNLAILPLGHIAEIANSFDWRQACGYLASALVLATFWMRQMVPLRVVAICSNVAFFSYAVLLSLPPVGILHAVLLPVNVWRLRQLTDRAGNADRPARLGSRAAMRGLSKGGLAVGLSLLLVGAAGEGRTAVRVAADPATTAAATVRARTSAPRVVVGRHPRPVLLLPWRGRRMGGTTCARPCPARSRTLPRIDRRDRLGHAAAQACRCTRRESLNTALSRQGFQYRCFIPEHRD